MPRGNDAEAAAQELAEREFATQYGPHQNAEQLRHAHMQSLDRELAAAQLKRVDEEATANLDLASITPSQGGTVLSASVRGGMVVYLAEGADGRSYKGVEPYEG
jgi:hypothetical protein